MKEKLFIAIILLLCLIPSLGMLLPKQAETGGNEVLATPPALRDASGQVNTNYLPQLMSYVEDNYFFRQRLVSAWSTLNQNLLRTSIAENVVLGRDGWLYFGDTLNDYTGAEQMTGREIFCAARNLRLMQEYSHSQASGKGQLVFVIAPNKNSLYPEHMPDFTVSQEPGNAERLMQALEGQSVSYIDLFSRFREQDETLYFTQDSHWNSKGAALAADAVFEITPYAQPHYFDQPFTPEANHLSDLYAMLYPTGQWLETDLTPGAPLSFTYDAPFRSANDMTIQTSGGRCGASLVMFRDSFGNLLYPYLADAFQTALFSRSMPYRMELVGERQPDYVVIELVERNLDYLVRNVPVMPAIERDAVTALPTAAVNRTPIPLATEPAQSMPGYALVQGTLPLEPGEDSSVSLAAGERCWEAFLLEDNGFALYVPETALAQEDLFVVFATRDEAVFMPASASN